VLNSPIGLRDPWGLAAGDCYPSENDAGFDASRDALKATAKNNNENAGWIIQNSDGTFTYNGPFNLGSPNGGTSIPNQPSGGVVGTYHDHPDDPNDPRNAGVAMPSEPDQFAGAQNYGDEYISNQHDQVSRWHKGDDPRFSSGKNLFEPIPSSCKCKNR